MIMDFFDLQHPIVTAIYKAYEEADAKEEKRGYLGASIIGAKCERYLWYTFRECCEEKFSGRMLRLFNTGDREEARMIEDLRMIGCEVHPFQPPPTGGWPNGKTFEMRQWEILALGDHFSGHLDGIMCRVLDDDPSTWYVNEFKTHNKRSFEYLTSMRVKKAQPKHYAQMQIYMHKMSITKALYQAVLKDTDELYIEVVEYNRDEAEMLMLRAKRIIIATEPPPRYSEDRTTFECLYCSANSICWGNPNLAKPEDALPRKSCRQCKHARPDIEQSGARWVCGTGANTLFDTSDPCAHYTLIPGILPEEKK